MLNSALPAAGKLPLLALAEFADLDGRSCYPSVARVAGLSSQNERTVRRQLDAAESEGWFSRQSKGTSQGWRRYEYTLLIPQGADTAPARPDSGADTQPAPSAPTCGLSVPNVRTLSTERAGTESDDLSITYPIPIQEQKLSRFAEFWAMYPRKDAKAKAAGIWQSKKLDPECERILADLRARSEDGQYADANAKFIPHATTYLTGRRWEDEWTLSSSTPWQRESLIERVTRKAIEEEEGRRLTRPQRLQRELERIHREGKGQRESLVQRSERKSIEQELARQANGQGQDEDPSTDFFEGVFTSLGQMGRG